MATTVHTDPKTHFFKINGTKDLKILLQYTILQITRVKDITIEIELS